MGDGRGGKFVPMVFMFGGTFMLNRSWEYLFSACPERPLLWSTTNCGRGGDWGESRNLNWEYWPSTAAAGGYIAHVGTCVALCKCTCLYVRMHLHNSTLGHVLLVSMIGTLTFQQP